MTALNLRSRAGLVIARARPPTENTAEIDKRTFKSIPEINNIPKTIPATIIAVPKSRPSKIRNRNPTVPIETIPIAFDCNPFALRSKCLRS